jgi:hypothetical protein
MQNQRLNYPVCIQQIFNFKTDKDIYQYQVEKKMKWNQSKGIYEYTYKKNIQKGTFTLIELAKNFQITGFEENNERILQILSSVERFKIFWILMK